METAELLAALGRLIGGIDRSQIANSAADIRGLGDEGHRLLSLLIRLAERAALCSPPTEISAPLVDAIIDARRLRARHFGPELADAGWTLLLTAYAARLDGRCCSVTQLGQAAELAPTTSLRWLHKLRDCGLLTWEPDPEDERSVLVDLSDEAADRMAAYIEAALRIAPAIL